MAIFMRHLQALLTLATLAVITTAMLLTLVLILALGLVVAIPIRWLPLTAQAFREMSQRLKVLLPTRQEVLDLLRIRKS